MKNIRKSPIVSINAYDMHTKRSSLTEVKGRPFYALTYRKTGTAKIIIDDQTIMSKENYITLTPKNQDYKTEIIEDTHIIAIHFECQDDIAYRVPFAFENKVPYITELFNTIFKRYSADNIMNYECFSLLYQLFAEIERYFLKKEENKIHPQISKAKKEIEKNFADNDFNIDKLLCTLSISSSYLRQEFNKTYSISPIAYLKKLRLQNAISMLQSDYYSIQEIAKSCGYSSVSYFIQVFHKDTGYSPMKYKDKYFKI